MTAVSLNVDGGVHLVKPAKLYMCTQKHYKHNKDKRMVPGITSSHGSLLLSHMGNVITGIRINNNLTKLLEVAKTDISVWPLPGVL